MRRVSVLIENRKFREKTVLLQGNLKFLEYHTATRKWKIKKHAATTGNSGTRNTATTVLLQENWNFQDNVLLLGNGNLKNEKPAATRKLAIPRKNLLLLGNQGFLEKHIATRKFEISRKTYC